MSGKPSRVGASYRLTPVSDGKSDTLPVLSISLSLNHFETVFFFFNWLKMIYYYATGLFEMHRRV